LSPDCSGDWHPTDSATMSTISDLPLARTNRDLEQQKLGVM
jgi:hypothetical protein